MRIPLHASLRTAMGMEPMGDATARGTIYAMAANECTILSENYQAESRLSSFAGNTSIVGPLPNTPSPNSMRAAVREGKPIKQQFWTVIMKFPSGPRVSRSSRYLARHPCCLASNRCIQLHADAVTTRQPVRWKSTMCFSR